jgi:hypothetical protein
MPRRRKPPKSEPENEVATTSVVRHRQVLVGRRLLRSGDRVSVTGLRGSFTFRSLVTNRNTGQRWADLYGGTPGRERARSVEVERLRPLPRPKGGVQLSLDEGG